MLLWWCRRPVLRRTLPFPSSEQRAYLVNVKLKWFKDRSLDSAVSRERHLRSALHLLQNISSAPSSSATSDDLSLSLRRRLSPSSAAAFMLRFPTLFHVSSSSHRGGEPRFRLTAAALSLRQLELDALEATEPDLVSRLKKLLMLTVGRSLPIPTVDQLAWDLALPSDYSTSLIPRYPQFFQLVDPPGDDERTWVKLLEWDPHLAVSQLERSSGGEGEDGVPLAFPVSFARGFGLKKKCSEWLKEWQGLPYTSPYAGPSGLDPRTDVSEKRVVGVFHELLHLTVGKKTERRNLSNLRGALLLPQKFTKVFERHPGIFYLSHKLDTQTVVLREAYGGGQELVGAKHPIVDIRERYTAMMRIGMTKRTRSKGSSSREMHGDDGLSLKV